jgi:transposase-like protein
MLSAEQVAGEHHQGKRGGEIVRHGCQGGVVTLSDRKVRVEKPRLRKRSGGFGAEVEVPAYAAMRSDGRISERILNLMMRGVSTRNYGAVISGAAEACGVSKSSVSREFVEASEEEYRRLLERRFDILIIYIDGIIFARHSVVAAIGVDTEGRKHILRIAEGATENVAVVTALLEDLVERGVKPDRKRLFVIDGSKALRNAIDGVYGMSNPVQRCRNHKAQNVVDHLPKDLRDQTKKAMRAAFRLEADDGMRKLDQLARSYERDYPSAAASIREGLSEMFTMSRLGISRSLARSLVTTNVIESPTPVSGLRPAELRTGRTGR